MYKNAILIIALTTSIAACSNQAQKTDSRPADLKRLIAHVDTAYKRYDKAYANELLQDQLLLKEIVRVNQFIKDSLNMKVTNWPGVLKNIRNEDGHVSFEVHIQKDLSRKQEFPELYSIILKSSISKLDESDINDFLNYKERDSVIISGAMVPDDQLLLLHTGYRGEREPFSRPVLNVLCEDLRLIPKKG